MLADGNTALKRLAFTVTSHTHTQYRVEQAQLS